MAIYQYHLTVVPRQTLLRLWNIIPVNVILHNNPTFDEDDLINVMWWDEATVNFKEIEKRILDFTDQVEWTKSSKDVKDFGDNDTNDISIGQGDSGLLEEMSFRIDLRKIDRHFIDNVLTIVKDLDCLLLDREGNLFEPTLDNLANNLKASDAYEFMTDPKDFLDKLGKERLR